MIESTLCSFIEEAGMHYVQNVLAIGTIFFALGCELDKVDSIRYSGGPLFDCPENIEMCTDSQPVGGECHDGDLLIVMCQVEICGSCCSTQFTIPIPCCNGYWLAYSNYFTGPTGALTDIPLCPNVAVTYTNSCADNMCICDSASNEDGWIVQDGYFEYQNVCDLYPNELKGRSFYTASVKNGPKGGSSDLAYFGPSDCKEGSPDYTIFATKGGVVDFGIQSIDRQSLRGCLNRHSDSKVSQDGMFYRQPN